MLHQGKNYLEVEFFSIWQQQCVSLCIICDDYSEYRTSAAAIDDQIGWTFCVTILLSLWKRCLIVVSWDHVDLFSFVFICIHNFLFLILILMKGLLAVIMIGNDAKFLCLMRFCFTTCFVMWLLFYKFFCLLIHIYFPFHEMR